MFWAEAAARGLGEERGRERRPLFQEPGGRVLTKVSEPR